MRAVAALSLLLAGEGAPAPGGGPSVSIEAAALKSHMTFLADDLLEGREAGTRGDALAQLYLRTRFEAIGLAPAGDPGGYLQRFRVRSTRLVAGCPALAIDYPDTDTALTLVEELWRELPA